MADAWTQKIMSCTLIVLILTLNSFSTCQASSVLQSVCNRTKNNSLCLTVLGSDERSGTAGLPQLAQIAIDMAEYEAIGTKYKIHALVMAAKDPKAKTLYEDCEGMYLDALGALAQAPDSLAHHQYNDLRVQGTSISDKVNRCGLILIPVQPQFNKEIRDVEIVGDALTIMAQDLSH